jgi:hypothetical protein
MAYRRDHPGLVTKMHIWAEVRGGWIAADAASTGLQGIGAQLAVVVNKIDRTGARGLDLVADLAGGNSSPRTTRS